MPKGFDKRIECLLCHIILEDSAAALSHECSTSSDPSLHTVEGALEQYRNNRIAEERAKAERAEFGKLCHANYLYYLTTIVVPVKGRHARDTLHLDIRTMDEFIASLDVSRIALTNSSCRSVVVEDAKPQPELFESTWDESWPRWSSDDYSDARWMPDCPGRSWKRGAGRHGPRDWAMNTTLLVPVLPKQLHLQIPSHQSKRLPRTHLMIPPCLHGRRK